MARYGGAKKSILDNSDYTSSFIHGLQYNTPERNYISRSRRLFALVLVAPRVQIRYALLATQSEERLRERFNRVKCPDCSSGGGGVRTKKDIAKKPGPLPI